jgi:hypothetical protein
MKRTPCPALFWMLLTVFVGNAALAAGPATAPSGGPAAPKELRLMGSVSQYGITWTFEEAVPVGQFVTGDYYVVGPVKVTGIDPKPADGRNGSCLNVSAVIERVGFDDRIVHGRYDGNLFLAPPIDLKPGDSLTSTISFEKVGDGKKFLWREAPTSPVKTAAVLTCLEKAVPPDAFRPCYGGKGAKIYLARDLRRDLLPRLPKPASAPKLADWERMFQRPWLDLAMDEFMAPVENMPNYGREFVRAVGGASLLLCTDYPEKEKEPLLIGLVQVGIDLWGLSGQGAALGRQPGSWNALGGHGNGRKWPILFAGILLNDADMRAPLKKYPFLRFSEDTQTMFDKCWTGAKVVWAGHVGKEGNPNHPDWGAYEHLSPDQWKGDTGESYRRCCTSNAWVAEALAARILHAEKLWDHDAFFAYVDRWMTEDDAAALAEIKKARKTDYDNDWARQGCVWDPWVKAMWIAHRDNLPAAPDGAKTPKAAQTWK